MGSLATDADGPWTVDAPVAQRLREAGTVLWARRLAGNMAGRACDSGLFGATHNPWKIGRTPGGSSGGGVAEPRQSAWATRRRHRRCGLGAHPCAFTGLFGLKPTRAACRFIRRRPRERFPTSGPMTRTVRDAAMMMNVMAAARSAATSTAGPTTTRLPQGFDKGVKGLRIAYSPTWASSIATGSTATWGRRRERREGVQDLGARVVEDSPDLQGPTRAKILNAHWQSNVVMLVKSLARRNAR